MESHRQKVTLSLDKDLYKEVKLQAVRENRDVSTITEDLYRGIKERKTTSRREAARPGAENTKASLATTI
jgi:hypothetical protein